MEGTHVSRCTSLHSLWKLKSCCQISWGELAPLFLKLSLWPPSYQPGPVLHHAHPPEVGHMPSEQEDLTELSFLYFLWQTVGLLFMVQMNFLNSMHPTSPQSLLYFLRYSNISGDRSYRQSGVTEGTSFEVTQTQVQISAFLLTSYVTLEESVRLSSEPFPKVLPSNS